MSEFGHAFFESERDEIAAREQADTRDVDLKFH
jgi:hypothetical protein